MIKNQTRCNELARLKAVSASELWLKHASPELRKQTSTLMRVVINMQEPSWRKRLYLYDTKDRNFLGDYFVAHGINSGTGAYAKHFSNKVGSLCTSLGAYITGSTYIGKHGLSLHVKGLEKGINDNAVFRDIEIHPAYYVGENYILEHGQCGHSDGCFAIDPTTSDKLIDLIKDGVFLYVYY